MVPALADFLKIRISVPYRRLEPMFQEAIIFNEDF